MWPWLKALSGWLIRLVGGWLPIGTKPVGEWLGKILWAVGIVALCLMVYRQVTRPTTDTHTQQRAAEIVNHYYQPTGGCASIRVRQSQQQTEQLKKVTEFK